MNPGDHSYMSGSEGGLDNPPVPTRALLNPNNEQSGHNLPSCDNQLSCQPALNGASSTGNLIVHNNNHNGGITIQPSSGSSSILSLSFYPSNSISIDNSQEDNYHLPSNLSTNLTVQPSVALESNINNHLRFQCEYCHRGFQSFRGLGVHKASAHPSETNRNINISRRKARWQPEDISRLADAEARAPATALNKINEYLLNTVKLDPPRTQESIKALRKSGKYKIVLLQFQQTIQEEIQVFNQPDISITQLNTGENQSNLQNTNNIIRTHTRQANSGNTYHAVASASNGDNQMWMDEALRFLRSSACDDPGKYILGFAIEDVRQGRDPCMHLSDWFGKNFGTPATNRKQLVNRTQIVNRPISKKDKRKKEYARVQQMWKTNTTKIANIILDGEIDNTQHLTLQEQVDYWKPIFEKQSRNILEEPATSERVAHDLINPISHEEIIRFKPSADSARGADGLAPKIWINNVCDTIKRIVMNIMLFSAKVPSTWARARTVLIPKSGNWKNPGNYRPISIASVIIRHYHKILANRIYEEFHNDERQRGFIRADGSAEIIYSISTILDITRRQKKQLHVAFLDIKKAFDSISQHSIFEALHNKGFPEKIIEYIKYIYKNSEIILEINGENSEIIKPGQGVRQGDPLSPIIFNLVMDEILVKISKNIGFEYQQLILNALAFADDLILLASTKEGLQSLLNEITIEMERHGLSLAPNKCKCLSLVPSGKDKKVKVIEPPQFTIGNIYLPQLRIIDNWVHLGVTFNYRGVVFQRFPIEEYLIRITKAPLKPQQRMVILKTYLLPRLLHTLVLGKVNYGVLQKIDRTIRKYTRQWLHLPPDVPIAYFHAKVKDGGLGIMALYTKIPALIERRINNLKNSSLQFARILVESDYINKRLRWASLHAADDEKWNLELYKHVDGWELRESSRVIPSSSWVIDRVSIPARDWIKYHMVRINALPTRIRTTRGMRRITQVVQCRAGCNVPETAAHVIQECHRTHGGRIMRHNIVSKGLSKLFSNNGYNVLEEPRISTVEGNRKPDLVLFKNGKATILDVQVVSGYRDLNEAHEKKKRYYALNNDVIRFVCNYFNLQPSDIEVSTVTISWRGIWAYKSYESLRCLNVSHHYMRGITTRILLGSYLNFIKFNKMTTVQRHYIWPFRRRQALQ